MAELTTLTNWLDSDPRCGVLISETPEPDGTYQIRVSVYDDMPRTEQLITDAGWEVTRVEADAAGDWAWTDLFIRPAPPTLDKP